MAVSRGVFALSQRDLGSRSDLERKDRWLGPRLVKVNASPYQDTARFDSTVSARDDMIRFMAGTNPTKISRGDRARQFKGLLVAYQGPFLALRLHLPRLEYVVSW